MKLSGYTAFSSKKDPSKRYVRAHAVVQIENSGDGDGAGFTTQEIECDRSCENQLRGLSFPADVDVEQRLVTIRTEYGERTGIVLTAVTPVKRTAA